MRNNPCTRSDCAADKARLERQYQELDAAYVERVKVLEQLRDALRAELLVAHTTNAFMTKQNDELREDFANTKAVMDKLIAEREKFIQEKQSLRAEVERLIGVVDIEVERKAKYMAEVERLTKQCKDWEKLCGATYTFKEEGGK